MTTLFCGRLAALCRSDGLRYAVTVLGHNDSVCRRRAKNPGPPYYVSSKRTMNGSHATLSGALLLILSLLLGCNGQRGGAIDGGGVGRGTAVAADPSAAALRTPARTIARSIRAPRRVILMIGDGMGVPAVTAAAYAAGRRLNMMTMAHSGFLTTHEYEHLTTDSAASATAMATGHKTHFEGVSVRPGTSPERQLDRDNWLETLHERADRLGWRTGLVATSRINHATPAAFAAHSSARSDYEGIALQMATNSVVDVMIGGGRRYFDNRSDGRDLLVEMAGRGYTVARSPAELAALEATPERLAALIWEGDPPYASGGRSPALPDLLEVAVEALDRGQPEGWVLMVEGSQIDWAAHALDGANTIEETLDFDQAVGAALGYARGRDDTLVVVVADHETGGLAVLDRPYRDHYVAMLGGPARADALAAPHPSIASSPEISDAPPAPAIAIGTLAEAGSGAGATPFGPTEDPRAAIVPVFGDLSVASRARSQDKGFIATHSPVMIPIFAEGPGDIIVTAAPDNAALGQALLDLVTAADAARPVRHAALQFSMEQPRNVVLMIGDGMGLAPVTAASYVIGGLAMEALPVRGLVSTHATDSVVNDSAATATALATGRRTRQGALGVVFSADGRPAPATTVVEAAEAYGRRTGVVTDVPLTHATPAAFYAHRPDRGQTPRHRR